jgi:transposase
VFVYGGTCDMRRQISGLMTMVREELGRDPQCGDLYVFRGRRSDQIKILFYDRRGYCMLVKRLDEGTFPIAHVTDGKSPRDHPSRTGILAGECREDVIRGRGLLNPQDRLCYLRWTWQRSDANRSKARSPRWALNAAEWINQLRVREWLSQWSNRPCGPAPRR